MAMAAAHGLHAVAVAAVLSSCVLPWGTVSADNATRVSYGWNFPYTDQIIVVNKVWIPMLTAGILLVMTRRSACVRTAEDPGVDGPRPIGFEAFAGPILAAAVSGLVIADSMGVVDALLPGRARVRYRTDVLSLGPGPWVALAGAVLGAASVLSQRGNSPRSRT